MNICLRLVPASVFLLAAFHSAPVQEDDPVYIEEEKKEFIDKIERCRTSSDWKGLFDLQAQAMHPKKAHKLVRLPGTEPKYVGLTEFVNRRFADLPADALKYYRDQFDGAARREFDAARKSGDRAGLERVVDTWFYSSRTDDALDLLANLHSEEGRLGLAIHCWTRLLHHYPDSEIPRAVTAARLARAAAASGHESILEGVRQFAKERKLEGDVIAGEGATPLPAFLDSLKVVVAAATAASAPRDPAVSMAMPGIERRLVGVRPEIRRWTADLTGGPEPAQPEGRRRGGMPSQPGAPDFPYLPAYARIDDHEMVVYTNGLRVTIIDPRRANAARPEEGIYFSYPPAGESVQRAQLPPHFQGDGRALSWMRPFIGVTIDGEYAFATLYSTKRQKDTGPPGPMGVQDTLYGMTRLVCLNLRTQQVAWDTDFGEAGNQLRKQDFWERNFSFSGPPLVRGDRVYAGVGTSPLGEEESRVACFDRRTGVVQWERFLASVSTGRNIWWGMSSLTSRLTILEEDRGSIIAHGNLGVLASLDAVTGHVRWLTKYPRTSTGPDRGQQPQVFSRPASPLVIYRGKIYTLPQDATDLLIVDSASGSIQKDTPTFKTALGPRYWRDFPRLVGRMGDFLVLCGTAGDSCIMNTATGEFHGLPLTNTSGTGRGMIDGETLYIPCVSDGKGGLGMFHGQRQWVAFERSVLWWPLGEGGNVVRGGNYLLFASNSKLSIFTDTEVLRAEFRRRLDQNPPNASAWLDYGMMMRGNERWAEAARAYLNFIEAVKGDPEWLDRSKEVQTELHGIFLKLGAEAMGGSRPVDAAAHYKSARDFSWDPATLTEATRLLAGACEKVAETRAVPEERNTWARQAVEEYQELILRAPAGFVKPTESMLWVPIRDYASTRIVELVRKHGAGAYEGVAWKAEEELKRARQDSAALRAVAERFPDSTAAGEALQRLAAGAAAEKRWTEAASAHRERRSRLWHKWTPADQKQLIEAVEKCGDAERVEAELKKMERLFEKKARLGPEENAPTVEDYLAKAKPAAAAMARRPAEPPPGSIATLSTWDPPVAAADAYQLAVGFDLILPGGVEPVKWPADLEFFARGSAVELWNIRTKKKSWTAPHPGGWTGLVYGEGPDDESGVRVMEIRSGSPAERAGIEAGDVIRSVDGAAVSPDDFDLAIEAKPAGSKFTLAIKRGEETRRADLTTDPWPGSARPGIVGAVFTSEGALAVAWEDLVAAFDVSDGRLLWSSRPGRSRFTIREIHASWERVLVHERYTGDRCRSSLRSPAIKEGLPSEDCHSRVIGLDERSGAPRWALGVKFDLPTAAHHRAEFLGRPLEDVAGVVINGAQPRTINLVPVSVEDGREFPPVVLSGTGGQPGGAWIVEPVTGTVWMVDSLVQGEARLRSYLGTDFSKGIEIPLKNVDPAATGYGLAATEDRVAVVSVSRAAAPPRLTVYSARDGSVVGTSKAGEAPFKDRILPGYSPGSPERKLISGLVSMGSDGLVLLYNEVVSKDPKVRGTRAMLTAVSAANGELKAAWDQVSPRVSPRAFDERAVLTVRSGPKGYFVTTHRGTPPGKTEEAAILAFLNRDEGGRYRKMVEDLAVPFDSFGQAGDPAPSRRGRVFMYRKTGLEILGD